MIAQSDVTVTGPAAARPIDDNLHALSAARRARPDTGQDRALAPTLKNHIALENHFMPGCLEASTEAFVELCNHRRYPERLN